VVWPTIINLIAFGSIWRPAEEAGISLKDVDAHANAPKKTSSNIDAEVFGELEEKLQAGQIPSVGNDAVKTPAAPAAPIALAESPVETMPQEHDIHAKEFAAKRDDFYPTELRTHPHDEPGGQ
jgi:hypothetical protein